MVASSAVIRPIAPGMEPMPLLAALVCNSLFDIAFHDAFGRLVKRPIYSTPFNIHTESGAVNTKKRRGKTPPITF